MKITTNILSVVVVALFASAGSSGVAAQTSNTNVRLVDSSGPAVHRPVVTGFKPTSGSVGTSITVTGSNFTGATVASVGGYPATFTFINDNTLTVIVPSGAKTGSVHVKNAAGLGASKENFEVDSSGYGITSFTPATGPVGTTITVNGAGFTNASIASVGGYPATVTIVNDSTLTFVVPAHAISGPIHVKTPAGLMVSSSNFTVPVSLAITGFTPASAGLGQTVTVTGLGFTSATAVSIDGYPAKFSVKNDGAVTFLVPPHAGTGVIHVKSPSGLVASATDLIVPLVPLVTSFSPTSGPVGTKVTVTGTNLGAATMISEDGLLADFTVLSDNSATFTVPDGAATGPVHVTNPTGYASGPSDFTVTP